MAISPFRFYLRIPAPPISSNDQPPTTVKLLLRIFQISALVFTLLVVWGWLVFQAEVGTSLPSPVAESVSWIARFPSLVKRVLTRHPPLRLGQNETGAPALAHAHIPNRNHHLLVSTLSEEHERPTIKLIRLHDRVVIHQWVPDFDEILLRMRSKGVDRGGFSRNLEVKSAFLHADLSIAFNLTEGSSGGPIVRLDSASNIQWVTGENFHHSLEIDAEGNYWAPLTLQNSPSSTRYGILDDGVAQVSPSGEVLFTRSLFALLVDNGLRYHVVGSGLETDPVHLNDIQPALANSEFWRRGDLFLSLRNRSLVLLYRVATDEIVWLGTGEWLNQHDVDILDSSRISIFGNNNLRDAGERKGRRPWSLADRSELYVYDFNGAEVSTPYDEAMDKAGIRAQTQGVSEIQPNGLLFISDTDRGRHLLLDSVSIRWEFVQVDREGLVLRPNWARLLTLRDDGTFVE